MKHHPEVLMLLLKRFEFDYSYMTYVKKDCAVNVPHTLQIPEVQCLHSLVIIMTARSLLILKCFFLCGSESDV